MRSLDYEIEGIGAEVGRTLALTLALAPALTLALALAPALTLALTLAPTLTRCESQWDGNCDRSAFQGPNGLFSKKSALVKKKVSGAHCPLPTAQRPTPNCPIARMPNARMPTARLPNCPITQ